MSAKVVRWTFFCGSTAWAEVVDKVPALPKVFHLQILSARKLSWALLALVVMLACGWAQPSGNPVRSRGWSFQLPLVFSPPVQQGLLSESFFYPAETREDDCQCHLLVYSLKARELKESGGDAAAVRLVEYRLGLALQTAPEQMLPVNFAGGVGKRRMFQEQVPRPKRVDILIPPTGDGSFLAIGVESYAGISQEQRQQIIQALATSLAKT